MLQETAEGLGHVNPAISRAGKGGRPGRDQRGQSTTGLLDLQQN
jgi:hypothetical protein